jgi:hypothetical protein
MTRLSRRQFLAALSATAAAAPFSPILDRWLPRVLAQGSQHHLYISRNGTPVTNVQRAVALAGGIQTFIGHDDAVVLKPNDQWPLQGYTHTQALKALIDVILNRPGGFAGEIIIAEHVHRSAPPASDNALSGSYCWNMSSGYNRTNNWAEMNYLELVSDYHTRDINNVTAIPLYDTGQSTDFDGHGAERFSGRQTWLGAHHIHHRRQWPHSAPVACPAAICLQRQRDRSQEWCMEQRQLHGTAGEGDLSAHAQQSRQFQLRRLRRVDERAEMPSGHCRVFRIIRCLAA